VSILAVFRGWLQGKGNMKPTAISEILEQIIKVCIGLLFAYLYRGNIQKSVTALLFAVTVSEFFAVCYMFIVYKRVPVPVIPKNQGGRVAVKEILKVSIFVTLTSALLPFSNMVESVFLPRLMGKYTTQAVSLYGLYAGGAVTLVGLPVSLCYGITAVTVPSVASAPKNECRKRIFYALGFTLLISIPCAVGLYLFAPTAVNVVYKSLSVTEKQTLIQLLRALTPTAVTLSSLQTLSACLTAQGKPQYSAISMLIAVLVKTLTYVFLLRNAQISVFGLAIATNLCYLVAFFIDLVYNLVINKRKKGEP
jgi:stage V sporulation protein B